jgi:hypothetical protein
MTVFSGGIYYLCLCFMINDHQRLVVGHPKRSNEFYPPDLAPETSFRSVTVPKHEALAHVQSCKECIFPFRDAENVIISRIFSFLCL